MNSEIASLKPHEDEDVRYQGSMQRKWDNMHYSIWYQPKVKHK
jgi:hypothetical protein